jgi:hypothetical protein
MNERLNQVLNDNKVPIGVGIVSFVIGVGTGMLISHIRDRRRTRIQYNNEELPQILEDMDMDALDEYVTRKELEAGIVRTPKEKEESLERARQTTEILRAQRREEVIEVEPDEEPEEQEENTMEQATFATSAGSDDTWNYEEEIRNRTPDRPHVIHKDEFFEADNGYHQESIVYYSGDDILVDQDNSPIYNHNKVVGEMKFGHGSDDPNVVYIRNDRLRAEYEVFCDPGLYSVEVLGLQIEDNVRVKNLKHSRGAPKFHME